MTSMLVAGVRAEARLGWALGTLMTAAACGGGEAGPSPNAAGSGGAQPAAGMSPGGASGSGVMPEGGRASGASGTGGSSSAATGGAAGTSSASGGAGAGAGGRASGGSAGAPGSGAGGMNAGRAGASGGAPPLGESGAGGEDASGGTGSTALSFAADIWPVFAMKRDPVFVYPGGTTYESCVTGGVCHGGPAPGAALKMTDAATAYGMLLDAPSNSDLCAGTIRVVAGNPAESCLILFYEGRLRDELDWVDTAEIDRVREWIAEGALP
jgi:hypothetical protein